MGCLDNIELPPCIWFQGERRNAVAALLAGLLFFIGWWIIIDVNVNSYQNFNGAYHLCGIFGTISLLMVNSVSNALLNGSGYDGGVMGQQGARVWLFMGFLTGFAAIIAACWILFADYVAKNTKENPIPQWAGSGLFLQNCFIFLASLVYKFGRTEESVY